MAISENEWDQRILCVDGNCIGIIGADGRCKLCGRPYDGELPMPGADNDAEENDDGEKHASVDQQVVQDEAQTADDSATGSATSDDADAWEHRTLCIDESCIGVVGLDGRCKECGKPHNG